MLLEPELDNKKTISGETTPNSSTGKNKGVRHFFADIYVTLFISFTFVYLQLQPARRRFR